MRKSAYNGGSGWRFPYVHEYERHVCTRLDGTDSAIPSGANCVMAVHYLPIAWPLRIEGYRLYCSSNPTKAGTYAGLMRLALVDAIQTTGAPDNIVSGTDTGAAGFDVTSTTAALISGADSTRNVTLAEPVEIWTPGTYYMAILTQGFDAGAGGGYRATTLRSGFKGIRDMVWNIGTLSNANFATLDMDAEFDGAWTNFSSVAGSAHIALTTVSLVCQRL